MPAAKAQEIEEAMLGEMARLEIEDTIDNRISFLEGLRDGWNEDPSTGFEKSMYLFAISNLLLVLKVKRAHATSK